MNIDTMIIFVSHHDRPSWEQEGCSREPESSRSRPDSDSEEVLFVRNKSLRDWTLYEKRHLDSR
jgi:hypothetical protein